MDEKLEHYLDTICFKLSVIAVILGAILGVLIFN